MPQIVDLSHVMRNRPIEGHSQKSRLGKKVVKLFGMKVSHYKLTKCDNLMLSRTSLRLMFVIQNIIFSSRERKQKKRSFLIQGKDFKKSYIIF